MTTVLGVYGSPRKGGNTDLLLDRALDGALSEKAEVSRLYIRDLKIEGCRACYGCQSTGSCVVQDDMQDVYPRLMGVDVLILATPIFFYGPSAQTKALIDRCQCKWCAGVLEQRAGQKRTHAGGRGYLLAVGATRGDHLFEGAQWTARYFFDALDKRFEGSYLVRKVDRKGEILQHPEHLDGAFRWGTQAVKEA